jgi:hypothetical protein
MLMIHDKFIRYWRENLMGLIRVIMGLGMMFIVPWIWMVVIGLALYGSISPNTVSSPDSAMGFVLAIWIIDYGGALVLFIIGIVITLSGLKDWWKAK